MRFSQLIIVFFLSLSTYGQSLSEATKTVANSTALRDGRFGFYAVDLSTNKEIVAHDIDRKMSPASTLKLLTTYAALDILGPDYRFRTRVGYTGEITPDGILKGDLIIEGGGDPALDSEEFRSTYGSGNRLDRQILKALRSYNIITVEGRIIVDEAYYVGIDIPDEWTWQDMGNYFAAGAHAFTFQENTFTLTLRSAETGSQTKLLRTDAMNPGVQIENHVEAADIGSDQAYIYASPGEGLMRIYGRIPAQKQSFEIKGAMSDPGAEFAARLEEQMVMAGIDVLNEDMKLSIGRKEDGSIDVMEIIDFFSPELIDIVGYTNMHSDNLYAEHLLRQIGKRKGEGSYRNGIKVVMEWCQTKGISTRGLNMEDGSGLSRANYVSPRFMVDMLKSLHKEPYYEQIKSALPVAGKSGSMRRVGKGSVIEGKMFAKTGYIEGARGYVGYLELEKRTIAFSILANDYDMSASEMRKTMSKLLVRLVQ